VLWGVSFPELFAYDSRNVLVGYYRFTRYDNIATQLFFARVLDSREEMEDGTIRERLRGHRAKFTFELKGAVANRKVMEFLRILHGASRIVIKPHPDEMFASLGRDFFECKIDGDWEYPYLDDRWIGHVGELQLIGNEILDAIPTARGVILPFERIIIAVKGVQKYETPPVCGAMVCSEEYGAYSALCTDIYSVEDA
jgi:hypothetical protein